MAHVMLVELVKDKKVSHKYLECPTVEDAKGIADKLNELNAYWGKKVGNAIKYFYEARK